MIDRVRLAACAAALLWATPAAADVLTLHATAQGGGAGGTGIAGAAKDNAFHDGTTGGAYGAMVGVEFLFVDGWVEHLQYRGADGLLGTWTQFMTGLDLKLNFGEPMGGKLVKGKREGDTYNRAYAELGLAVGFGVGTGQQVDPPLDRSEVTDKGFLVQSSFMIGYRLNRVISLNARLPVQYGYLFKSGDANDEGNQYQSLHGSVLFGLRFDLQLK